MEDSYFLNNLMKFSKIYNRSNFKDSIAYECFVNDIYINNYESENVLQYGIAYILDVFSNWNQNFTGQLTAIIAAPEDGEVKVRFHSYREGESWLAPDIEGYEEAVMSINSDEKWLKERFQII